MYNPTPFLLQGDAAELDPAGLAVHVAIALEVLGIAGRVFDPGETLTVEHALGLQVNYQVEAFPVAVLASEGAAGQSATYRRNKDGVLPAAHATAAQMIDQVKSRAATAVAPAPAPWRVLRSLR